VLVVHEVGVTAQMLVQPPSGGTHHTRDERVQRDRDTGAGPVPSPIVPTSTSVLNGSSTTVNSTAMLANCVPLSTVLIRAKVW
jgi:hypothetical protein